MAESIASKIPRGVSDRRILTVLPIFEVKEIEDSWNSSLRRKGTMACFQNPAVRRTAIWIAAGATCGARKKEPDPDRGRTTTGGTTAALSAFHEFPIFFH
jgi:hypothetical protein